MHFKKKIRTLEGQQNLATLKEAWATLVQHINIFDKIEYSKFFYQQNLPH